MFHIALYTSLVIFLGGMFYRLGRWIRLEVGDEARGLSSEKRALGALKSALGVVFSLRILVLAKVFILDVLLLRKVFTESIYRWAMHMAIFYGFMTLLIVHSMQAFVSYNFFDDYEPTLNPYLFIRNLAMAMVLAGVIMAIIRRRTNRWQKVLSGGMDAVSLILLAVIMLSGVFLEAAKLNSYRSYDRMVEDYAALSDEEEENALKAFWQENYATVFPHKVSATKEALEMGATLNEDNCASCHSPAGWAFISYPIALSMRPVAVGLTNLGFETFLFHLHFMACFIGLAWLPFGKFLHVVTTPLNLMVGELMKDRDNPPEAVSTKAALDLDACTHCGICSEHCSVNTVFGQIPNPQVLPSERLDALRRLLNGVPMSEEEKRVIKQGNDICTRCHRCTIKCPAGINLQELWFRLGEELNRVGAKSEFKSAQASSAKSADNYADPQAPLTIPKNHLESGRRSTFLNCFQCRTCSGACPVVAVSEATGQKLDLAPHQIMRSLGLGFTDWAEGAAMTWDCLTCYQCQEACPQGVRITDILYELRNQGVKKLNGRSAEEVKSAGQGV